MRQRHIETKRNEHVNGSCHTSGVVVEWSRVWGSGRVDGSRRPKESGWLTGGCAQPDMMRFLIKLTHCLLFPTHTSS